MPGDRIVDRVQAGGARDRPLTLALDATFSRSRLTLVEVGDQFVEAGEQLVRGQVEGGEVEHGRAQSAHGGGGVQAVADDVADNQRHAEAGQRDDVEPVPADPRCAGR